MELQVNVLIAARLAAPNMGAAFAAVTQPAAAACFAQQGIMDVRTVQTALVALAHLIQKGLITALISHLQDHPIKGIHTSKEVVQIAKTAITTQLALAAAVM